mmetsp:Transcript_65023/g.155111  ORF Transcript_65023/g.155111 Transcript_65023/m.155111 type:complete len:342 (+) Transcript_65023:661-1686(+)
MVCDGVDPGGGLKSGALNLSSEAPRSIRQGPSVDVAIARLTTITWDLPRCIFQQMRWGVPRFHVGVRHPPTSDRPNPVGGSVMSATEIGRRIETNVMPRMLFAGSDTATVYLPGTKSRGMVVSTGEMFVSPSSFVNRCTVFPREVSTPMQFLRRTLTRGTFPIVSHETCILSPATMHPSSTWWTQRRGWTFSTSNRVSCGDTSSATGICAASMPHLSARRSIIMALVSVTSRVARERMSLRAPVIWRSSSAMCLPTSSIAIPVIAPAAEDMACKVDSAAPRTPSFSIRSILKLRRPCASRASPHRELAHERRSTGSTRAKHGCAKYASTATTVEWRACRSW